VNPKEIGTEMVLCLYHLLWLSKQNIKSPPSDLDAKCHFWVENVKKRVFFKKRNIFYLTMNQ